jgi:hypothetical protein
MTNCFAMAPSRAAILDASPPSLLAQKRKTDEVQREWRSTARTPVADAIATARAVQVLEARLSAWRVAYQQTLAAAPSHYQAGS